MKFAILANIAVLTLGAAASFGVSFGGSDTLHSLEDESLKVPGENPLYHCEKSSDDILTLESVDLDPNPPKPGATLSIVAKGNLSEEVEEGAKVHLTVKYGLITILRQTADLCETVKKIGLECPLKNQTSLTQDVDLPKEIPPGKYTVIADVKTKDEDKITCLTATVSFSRGGSMSNIHGDM